MCSHFLAFFIPSSLPTLSLLRMTPLSSSVHPSIPFFPIRHFFFSFHSFFLLLHFFLSLSLSFLPPSGSLFPSFLSHSPSLSYRSGRRSGQRRQALSIMIFAIDQALGQQSIPGSWCESGAEDRRRPPAWRVWGVHQYV